MPALGSIFQRRNIGQTFLLTWRGCRGMSTFAKHHSNHFVHRGRVHGQPIFVDIYGHYYVMNEVVVGLVWQVDVCVSWRDGGPFA